MAVIETKFVLGPEGWCSYDYHASVIAGQNIFIQTTWSSDGGVEGGSYVWTDHTRWSADTPEKPLSILPLIRYQGWVGKRPVDLRGAELAVSLRGDGLQFNGAECYFWVHAGTTRWHCSGRPIEVTDGCWPVEPTRFLLEVDEALWHRSWSGDPATATGLEQLLANAESYGFSFVGFGSEVSGRLSLGSFAISSAKVP